MSRTPSSIRRLTGPNPRVIDKELWAKILWAAMNLELDDLPVWRNGNDLPPYPIEMVRAIAVVWCFTALRSDKIRRLCGLHSLAVSSSPAKSPK